MVAAAWRGFRGAGTVSVDTVLVARRRRPETPASNLKNVRWPASTQGLAFAAKFTAPRTRPRLSGASLTSYASPIFLKRSSAPGSLFTSCNSADPRCLSATTSHQFGSR